ncbi:hypothetical protein TWF569_002083 [Orbilia oligospora]|uniref:LAGLIDADG endonuclease n=1 Tax=Orbilia oligospora TaxID=2813651 RepID=A0A7C8J1P0_ORBOL|nr:hypothetical protein TWF102_002608 [Orbilia oligospora]KAF3087480.1 hypothetical protein TWF706_011122 [Orbilia oligospora]KAF3095612.1 hypothetical protein TWF103_010079 [Orbilia oligospora]KAF3122680.1 hypothetical protein TWF569_002083 [Orbilia oligospora]KAF3130516.1 hypothetical protein TWF594_010388 [Orbilia oligospora]
MGLRGFVWPLANLFIMSVPSSLMFHKARGKKSCLRSLAFWAFAVEPMCPQNLQILAGYFLHAKNSELKYRFSQRVTIVQNRIIRGYDRERLLFTIMLRHLDERFEMHIQGFNRMPKKIRLMAWEALGNNTIRESRLRQEKFVFFSPFC